MWQGADLVVAVADDHVAVRQHLERAVELDVGDGDCKIAAASLLMRAEMEYGFADQVCAMSILQDCTFKHEQRRLGHWRALLWGPLRGTSHVGMQQYRRVNMTHAKIHHCRYGAVAARGDAVTVCPASLRVVQPSTAP